MIRHNKLKINKLTVDFGKKLILLSADTTTEWTKEPTVSGLKKRVDWNVLRLEEAILYSIFDTYFTQPLGLIMRWWCRTLFATVIPIGSTRCCSLLTP